MVCYDETFCWGCVDWAAIFPVAHTEPAKNYNEYLTIITIVFMVVCLQQQMKLWCLAGRVFDRKCPLDPIHQQQQYLNSCLRLCESHLKKSCECFALYENKMVLSVFFSCIKLTQTLVFISAVEKVRCQCDELRFLFKHRHSCCWAKNHGKSVKSRGCCWCVEHI